MDQIAVFGEVLVDCFPDGNQILGGAPFNVAWHLQAFKAQPLFISRVGNDRQGKLIRFAMQNWGMSIHALQIDDSYPTGKVSVSFNGTEPCYDIVADSAYDFIDVSQLPTLPANSLIYHGSLAFRQKGNLNCLSYLQQMSAQRFVDVNLRSPWWNLSDLQNLIDGAQWLKLNDEEGKLLAKITDQNDQSMILHTYGSAGASLVTQQGEKFQIKPERKNNVVDTVGAGDAFSSVILLGILNNWPFELSLQRAQEFASAIVSIRGAISQDKAFYQPFINAWHL